MPALFLHTKTNTVTAQTTIRTILSDATATLSASSPSARLDAELLLCLVTGWSRAQLIARANDTIDTTDTLRYHALITRRGQGESVAYLCNEREFYGHAFFVDARVLVPRPETELLVACALAAARILTPDVILDIGSGSGCIGVTLALADAAPLIIAGDISAAALAVTAINCDRHAVTQRMHLLCSDLCTALVPLTFIVSNPPYVMDDDSDEDVHQYEPHLALFGGDDDGCAVYRRLAQLLPHHLRGPGYFACEIDPRQCSTVCTLLLSVFPAGRIVVHNDLAGHARVVELWLDA